ncbi:drongo protein isoform 2 [Tribolium castaneum]|uniref:Drongo n=1 Tax=Tribolium castaneum TaxID=7070 RepID=D6WJA2_TRICA|nr:drongo protein isoform 2 [Tribolium castaneum]EFA04700.1 drongo [Tribolium castaneum]|eukprot:NP_001164135.1 drongo protein isoform 2 [Tribolium castaneum]
MASSRKKQDEKNLKTLRELGAQPQNKYCFDCNQRGPTYVNMTIGSFVCTKCSGMLRGLTPPHRVKSISMATFTSEEIELLKNRGNDYCKSVWLGLYDGTLPGAEYRDEQAVKDFMVDKYERKRYYMEPAQALKNGYTKTEKVKPLTTLVSDPKPIKLNGNATEFNRKRPEPGKNHSFAVDFDNADIFASNNNNTTTTQETFANFDDNPVFNSKMNNASMPTPTFDNFNLAQSNKVPAAPPEDKYAALKDLDNALKTQNAVDWNSSGSNGSLYSSPTPTGSMYSSPSPQSSMFGSPSQGQFMNAFQNQDTFSNPFNGMNWGSNGNFGQNLANPFREPPVRVNGFAQNFQPMFPVAANGGAWGANPFKVGATANVNSNNPFL